MAQSRSHWVRSSVSVLLGITCGLGIAEAAFHLRDGGAFPHLNVYTADAQYGVRLRPGATTKIRFGGAEASHVAIHGGGFRGENNGPEPAVQKDELLFVGDSQTFGLGVEASQAFPARFAQLAARPAYNAGVPTWGPPEFIRAIRELGPRRHPSTIVYVVNLANDLFEAERPNPLRHAVWDGWAVRKETAPAMVTEFPGRELLFQRSHLVFALRQWWHRRGSHPAEDTERGMPSEGTFRDLFKLGQSLSEAQQEARRETERRARLYETESDYAQEAYRLAESRVRAIVWEELKLGAGSAGWDPNAQGSVYLAADANPGDIVTPGIGEEGRPVYASAVYIRQAVELRNRFEAQLVHRAEHALESAPVRKILALLSERDRARLELAVTRSKPLEIARASSPLTMRVLEAKREADALGARFALVVLPIDVMVSPAEWPKHGSSRVDLKPAQVLVQDLVESVRQVGGVALDASASLAEAEPGAFLPSDLHMTAKGHDAVARALLRALSASEPMPAVPALALTAGRSRVPPPAMWDSIGGQTSVEGSSRCPVTRKFREWLYISCYPEGPKLARGVGLQVIHGGLNDAVTWVRDGRMTLVAPIPPGEPLEALFSWSDGQTKRLLVTWDAAGRAPDVRMSLVKDGPAAAAIDQPTADRVCACEERVHPGTKCSSLVANADPNCVQTYGDECPALLACAQGDALYPPHCPAGSSNVGASLHCGPDVADVANTANIANVARATLFPAPPPSGAAPSRSELENSENALITAAQAFVGSDCKLGGDEIELIQIIPFDRCGTDEARVSAYEHAFAAFDALAARASLRGEADTFRQKAGAFAEFVREALKTRDTRGTAAFFQDLALAHNAWLPQKAVPVDPPSIVALYFGLSGRPQTDYFRNLHGDGPRRKAAYETSGEHFSWRRGPNGWEGPYLAGDPRVTSGEPDPN